MKLACSLCLALGRVALMALPFVLDVVFLPVALPRDLIVHGIPD
jgi:hypothetical protein